MIRPLALALLALLPAAPGWAHEFWIEPATGHSAPGTPLIADILVGADMKGSVLPYSPDILGLADLTLGDRTVPIKGRWGDIPALVAAPLGEGLHVLRYQSAELLVTYESFDKFLTFLQEAQRPDVLLEHRARGLSETDVTEPYYRFAKSLIGVGHSLGADRPLGMPFELTALTNPYTDPGAIRMELRYQGAVQPDAAIHIFHRAADGTRTDLRLRTDPAGQFSVPRLPGFTMVNAINILAATPRMQAMHGAHWQSLWASLTYDIDAAAISPAPDATESTSPDLN